MSAPTPFGYYDAPATSGAEPRVLLLFRVYASVMALGYIVFALFLTVWTFLTPGDGSRHLANYALGLVPTLLAVLHGYGAMMPRRPGAWTVGVVVLAFGVASCGIVFAIPLLVYWLRPECRAAFMRA